MEKLMSNLERAASLPPDAPPILSVADDISSEAGLEGRPSELPVIDIDALEDDARDLDWQAFLREAKRYRQAQAIQQAVEIEVDEFEDALRDPRVKKFLQKSKDYVQALEDHDRNL